MAFFSSGSRALVEILTRLQSAERPMPVDQTFFEFGSMKYHIQASPSDPENVHLSISTPSLSHEASPSTALPEFTLQETMKTYRDFAEVVEPTREGYALTLKLNFSGLARPKDRAKAIQQVSRLHSVVLSSQLKHILGNLGSSGTTKLVYNHRDPFFVSRTPGKLNAIFPMRFRDDTDLAVATSFFQELQDAGNSYSKAPKCSWSAIPPPELRGESVHHLTTNGGFVSFDILERHVKRRRAAKTAWILFNFQSYVKYHIKCTRSYIQSRMRKRQDRLTERPPPPLPRSQGSLEVTAPSSPSHTLSSVAGVAGESRPRRPLCRSHLPSVRGIAGRVTGPSPPSLDRPKCRWDRQEHPAPTPYLTIAAQEITVDASLPPRPHVLSLDDWSDLFHLPLSEEALGEFLSTSVS